MKWKTDAFALLAALAFCLALVGLGAAKAKHEGPDAAWISVHSACPSFEGALAVVTAQTEEARLATWRTNACFSSRNPAGVMVVVHTVEGMAVWGADGLDDMMVILQVYDRAGSRMWLWAVKEQWDANHPTSGASPSNHQI